MNDYYVIDFETASRQYASACSIGIVGVKNNKITLEKYYLINPEMAFNIENIVVHGITPSMVKNEKNFKEVWKKISKYFDNTFVFAHNAMFDMGVLKESLSRYNLTFPSFKFGCTVKMAQLMWPKGEILNHKLNTIAQFIGTELDHHNAMSDAKCCANIVIRAMKMYQCDEIEQLYHTMGLEFGELSINNYIGTRKIR